MSKVVFSFLKVSSLYHLACSTSLSYSVLQWQCGETFNATWMWCIYTPCHSCMKVCYMWQYHKRTTWSYYDLKGDVSFSSRSDGILRAFGKGFIFVLWIVRRIIQFQELNDWFNHRISDLFSHKGGEKNGASVSCQTFFLSSPSSSHFHQYLSLSQTALKDILALQWLRSREQEQKRCGVSLKP